MFWVLFLDCYIRLTKSFVVLTAELKLPNWNLFLKFFLINSTFYLFTGLIASFRGYPLNGHIVNLPEGYKGLILKETAKPVSGNERTFHVTHTFQNITYWNWDKIPSKDDAFLSALDWVDIAEAVS